MKDMELAVARGSQLERWMVGLFPGNADAVSALTSFPAYNIVLGFGRIVVHYT